MQVLEKILEEIDEAIARYGENPYIDEKVTDLCYGLNLAKDIVRKHMNDGWIPVEEKVPDSGIYIFLSFTNFTLPMIGRYEKDSDGGAFYIGDEEETCVSQDLYVNAWRPLPEPYKPERRVEK